VTATATNTATFTASPTTPPLPTISLNPASVSLVLGSSADLTVSISIAQSSNTLISLSSSNGSVASTASSVTIPPGATSASFSVDGQGAGAATLTASLPGNLGGGSASATANVDKGPTTTTFTLNQNIVIVGQSVTATYLVTGAGTITGDVEISVEGVVVCVASAPSGSCVGTPVSVGVKTVKVTYLGDANFNGSEGTVALSVNGLSIALDPSFSCTTANAVTLTARINVAQPNDSLVTLSSDSASNVQPAVTIPAGSLSATFPVVRASGVFNATSTIRAQLPASLGGDNALARVEFAAPPPFGNC
ncbi:MAG TPA: hypothetical protein VJ020_01000, partial [Anaerolineales bacterium]|nr:hypothetical protein [Anaerolineales bacterium]